MVLCTSFADTFRLDGESSTREIRLIITSNRFQLVKIIGQTVGKADPVLTSTSARKIIFRLDLYVW